LELLYPEVDEQSGTAFADRKSRLRLASKMERNLDYAGETFDRIHEELDKDEASGEQREWDDRDERRRSDERARGREEDRRDVRLELEVEERRVLLVLTVITTLAAIVLAYLAIKHERVGYAGVSILSALLSSGFLRLVRRPWAAVAGAAEGTLSSQPYRWSVLALQTEVDGEDPSESGS